MKHRNGIQLLKSDNFSIKSYDAAMLTWRKHLMSGPVHIQWREKQGKSKRWLQRGFGHRVLSMGAAVRRIFTNQC